MWTAVGFGAALVFVGLAAATHSVIPVFVAWIPLLVVPWVLTRPEAPTNGPERAASPVEDAGSSQASPADTTGNAEPAAGSTP